MGIFLSFLFIEVIRNGLLFFRRHFIPSRVIKIGIRIQCVMTDRTPVSQKGICLITTGYIDFVDKDILDRF
ncbi:Uncharacterised protein [Chlamydia trachomatis]|nr:Uncharacterised protein [Chlamydia trachomatis]